MRFSGYRFDSATARLWSGQDEVRLTPKASAVLQKLLSHAGEPVSKAELFASVWNDTVVSDDALSSCVQELRRALADDARQPRFIETRHRRGYRFMAELTDVPLTDAPVSDVPAEKAAAPPSPAPDLSAIAVLPFADMSPEGDQDYLCVGLAEELIHALAQVPGLRVASRTASFRNAGADVRDVGQKLGVGILVEGSVRKADNRLRVTVQVIEVATGYHRWSQRFDRTLDDVFAVQDEIAMSVAATLRRDEPIPPPKPLRPRPRNSALAYDYYLRGRQHLSRMTRPSLEQSREMFERAIALDAEYAPPWACMTAAHGTLYEWFGGRDEDMARADQSSQRAIELAPNLAEAHLARGIALSLALGYDEAARQFEEAVRLNPNLFEAYYYFARTCFAHGETRRAADLFRKAGETNREDFQSPMLEAQALRVLGRDDEAREARREGIRRAEHMLALNPLDGRALSLGSGALYDDGQETRAIEWSQRALDLYPDDASALVNGACLYAKRGLKDEALDLLERVFARGWGKRDWVTHDPDYDLLRDDPRFQALLSRLK